MNIFYQNETLYVNIDMDLNMDMVSMMERRIFNIVEDYGIDKISIKVLGKCDLFALNKFKKDYYHKYKGYLVIR